MSKIKKLASGAVRTLRELSYASIPYMSSIWTAISTGNILEASPVQLAFTAKEHYFQYTQLIKDTERAVSYIANVNIYIKYLEGKPVCNLPTLKTAFKELSELLKTLQSDKGIREHLDLQQLMLNNTLAEFRDTHDVNQYIRNLEEMSNKIFVKSWPGWYRNELNSHINRVNILLDEAMIQLQNKQDKCTLETKLKPVTVPMPVDLDLHEEEIFYDALQTPQLGERRVKKKSRSRRTVKKR